MNKKIIAILILSITIAAGSAFYGGMEYQQSKTPAIMDFQNFRDLSSGERQQRFQEMGANVGLRGVRMGNGTGFISGEIISKDDKSIVVKFSDGGSKIIFFSDSTEVAKSASGSINDVEVGRNISVSGAANQDGSITAQTIQLR